MTQNSHTMLLEVIVTNQGGQSWEWKVVAGEEILVVGFEATQLAARAAGNDALFLTLSLGCSA
jgi:primosomal replication protein N